MTVANVNMIGLAPKQLKIFGSIITRIAVEVMDHFMRLQVTAKHLLHDKAVLQNIPVFARIGMPFRRTDEHVTIFTNLAPALPGRVVFPSFAEHRVGFARKTLLAKHRIIRPAQVPIVRRVLVSKIPKGHTTANRAEFGMQANASREELPALQAGNGF